MVCQRLVAFLSVALRGLSFADVARLVDVDLIARGIFVISNVDSALVNDRGAALVQRFVYAAKLVSLLGSIDSSSAWMSEGERSQIVSAVAAATLIDGGRFIALSEDLAIAAASAAHSVVTWSTQVRRISRVPCGNC